MRWSLQELRKGMISVSNKGSKFWYRVKHFHSSVYWQTRVLIKWIFKGYCDISIFDLDSYLANVIADRLGIFINMKKTGHPTTFEDQDEWESQLRTLYRLWNDFKNNTYIEEMSAPEISLVDVEVNGEILKKIQFSNQTEEDSERNAYLIKKQQENNEEALRLFAEYFGFLWD